MMNLVILMYEDIPRGCAIFFSCHDLKIYFPTEKENKEELKQGCFEKLSKSSLLEAAAIKKIQFLSRTSPFVTKETSQRKTGRKPEENWRKPGGKPEENWSKKF